MVKKDSKFLKHEANQSGMPHDDFNQSNIGHNHQHAHHDHHHSFRDTNAKVLL